MYCVSVEIRRLIEPDLRVVIGDIHDQRLSLPVPPRVSHPQPHIYAKVQNPGRGDHTIGAGTLEENEHVTVGLQEFDLRGHIQRARYSRRFAGTSRDRARVTRLTLSGALASMANTVSVNTLISPLLRLGIKGEPDPVVLFLLRCGPRPIRELIAFDNSLPSRHRESRRQSWISLLGMVLNVPGSRVERLPNPLQISARLSSAASHLIAPVQATPQGRHRTQLQDRPQRKRPACS
jgi:hypothetical protein